jgi:hypothetical protein
MTDDTFDIYRFENLSSLSRAIRITISISFIWISVSVPGPLSILFLLPLLAIYFFATGLLAWDPINELFRHEKPGAIRMGKTLRTIYGLTGALLISSVFVSPVAPLGWLAIMPLVAIYPIFGAIAGLDLLDAAFNAGKIQDKDIVINTTAGIHQLTDLQHYYSTHRQNENLYNHNQAA